MESSETRALPKIRVRDAAYLAAMLDGEGHISGTDRERNGVDDSQLIVGISNCSEVLLQWLVENFGGRWRWREPRVYGRRPHFEWYPPTEHRREILKAVLPHIKIKRGQCLLAIGFCNTVNQPGRRRKLIQAIRRLNSVPNPEDTVQPGERSPEN